MLICNATHASIYIDIVAIYIITEKFESANSIDID